MDARDRMSSAYRENFPLHLVQRSRRGEACFEDESDCRAYLRALGETAGRLECAVHAYVLMGNHVHLLVTPSRGEGAEPLMRGLAERHALSTDEARDLFSPLSGRARDRIALPFSPSLSVSRVHAHRYVLACMRYIELNPVRAGLAARPEDHRWSSYHANALGAYDRLVTPHALYCALGRSPADRRAAYRALVAAHSSLGAERAGA